MEKIYLPKKHYEHFKGMNNSALLFAWKDWQTNANVGTADYGLMQVMSINTNDWLVDAIVKIIKGEIEVLQKKEIKYRLYHEQEPNAGQGLFKYHYFTKNAGLDETDCFENIDILTKEEAYELIDDMGEWLGEWLYEVED